MQQETRRHWLFGALQGLVATVLAALLLWALMPAIVYPPAAPAASDATLTLQGRQFEPVVAGRARVEGDSMVVDAMQTAMRDGQRFGEAVWRLAEPGFTAENYAQLRLHLEGVQQGQTVILFWRSAAANEQHYYAELAHDPDGIGWLELWPIDSWRGELQELTVGVFGPPGTAPLHLRELNLHGINRSTVAQRSLADWRRFKPWQQSSANRYAGVRGATPIHPAAAAGLWASLALLLVAGWQIWRRGPVSALVIAGLWALLLPWLALDALWQAQLQRQLQDTRAQFGVMSQADKHTRDADAALLNYAARLQQILQPLRHRRLFLLHDTAMHHDYLRLRLQFRLLPLNVYNYGNTLVAAEHLHPGDLVLLFRPLAGVHYDPASGLLGDGEQQVAATLLDEHPLGSLYRIEEPSHAQ